MNDASVDEAHASRSAPTSRCDNYTSYLDETYGYTYAARDVVELQELEHHDALASGDEQDLAEQDVEALNDFLRLGLAHGWRRSGRLEECLSILEQLMASDDDHPAVAYSELPLLAARLLVDREAHERAIEVVERALDRDPPDDRELRQLEGLALYHAEGAERANAHLEELVSAYPDDVDLQYEIAEDFAITGAEEAARTWIDRTRQTAERLGDRAIEVDLDLLASRLEEDEPST